MEGITFLIVAVLLAVVVGNSLGFFSIGKLATGTPSGQVNIQGCMVEDTTLSTSTLDSYNPGAGNKDVLTELWLNGNFVGSKDDQTSFSASPGDKYKMVAFDDGSTNADPTYDWYGQIKQGQIGCKGTAQVVFNLAKEGAVSMTVWNEDGSVNGASNEQDITAGETISLDLQAKETTDDAAFGAPDSNVNMVACFDYNTSQIESVEVVGGTKTGVPDTYVGTCEDAYSIPIHTLGKFEKYKFSVSIKAKPDLTTNSTLTNDINVKLLDPALFINSETGQPEYGVVDNDGNAVGASDGTATIYLS